MVCEWRFACQQFVKCAAQTVDVCSDVDVTPVFDLLGRNIVSGSHRLASSRKFNRRKIGSRIVGLLNSCQAKVKQFYVAVLVNHDVGGLDITVH